MSTRRAFLKTGVVFCSCALLNTATRPAGRRRLAADQHQRQAGEDHRHHSHCHFCEAGALLGAEAAAVQVPSVMARRKPSIEIDKRLKAMDAQAVTWKCCRQSLLVRQGSRAAGQIVKIRTRSWPSSARPSPTGSRLRLATLQAPDLAVIELETAVKKQA